MDKKMENSKRILDEIKKMKNDTRWSSNIVYDNVLYQFINDFKIYGLTLDLAWFQKHAKYGNRYIPEVEDNLSSYDYNHRLKDIAMGFVEYIDDYEDVYWCNAKDPKYNERPLEIIYGLKQDIFDLGVKRVFEELENRILWGNKGE